MRRPHSTAATSRPKNRGAGRDPQNQLRNRQTAPRPTDRQVAPTGDCFSPSRPMHQQIAIPRERSHFARLNRAALVAGLALMILAADIGRLTAQTQKKSAAPSRKGQAAESDSPGTQPAKGSK